MPALESVFFKYKDEEAEEVKRYAQSREGLAEHEQEIEEARQERERAELQDAAEGLPAPSAPQLDEPNTGIATPPVLAPHPEGRGPGGDVPMVIPPLPWDNEDPVPPEGRILRKLPPPPSAAKVEPESKRVRIEEPSREGASSSASRTAMIERRVERVYVDGQDLYHLDEIIDPEALAIEAEPEEAEELEPGAIPEGLWSDHPLTQTPPQPSAEVDAMARRVEEKRLTGMEVIEKLKPEEADLDVLTTRFVYDWRIKTYVGKDGKKSKRWLRRARLVARDYAVDKRDDVYSPASGQHALRLLPVLFLTAASAEMDYEHTKGKPVIGALDVKDAFLQVPQERPLRIITTMGEYKVLRNLPGQRIGAKAWYEHLRSYLIEQQGFEFDIINPCLGKKGAGEDLGEASIRVQYIGQMKEKFDIEVNMAKEYGEEFSFLKRKYVYTAEGLLVKPGGYAANMVKTFEDYFGPVRRQRIPATADIQDYDGSSTARDGEGARVGQREFEQFREQHIEKGKVMKIAKYLNRLVLVSGLELATGARVEPDLSEEVSYMDKLFYLIMIAAVIFMVWWIRRRFKDLENRIVILENELEAVKYNHISTANEQERVWSMQVDYTQRIHRALIYRGGYVEDHSIRDGLEWDTLKFLEKINRRHEGLHLKVQWDVVNQRRREQGESRIPNRFSIDDPGPPRDDPGDERMLSGETATVELDSGQVVDIPIEYLEIAREVIQAPGTSREPEPSPEGDDEDMEGESTPEQTDPDAWQPEPIEIPESKFAFYNRPYNRADLKARQELAKIEASWYHATR
ncbi:Copia protein, partial [Durusdinium trenchii]